MSWRGSVRPARWTSRRAAPMAPCASLGSSGSCASATASTSGPSTGPTPPGTRGTRTRMQGHIQAGGLTKDVAFVDADHGLDDAIDDACRTKYRGSSSAVSHITSEQARATTIELVPSPARLRITSTGPRVTPRPTSTTATSSARGSRSRACSSGPAAQLVVQKPRGHRRVRLLAERAGEKQRLRIGGREERGVDIARRSAASTWRCSSSTSSPLRQTRITARSALAVSGWARPLAARPSPCGEYASSASRTTRSSKGGVPSTTPAFNGSSSADDQIGSEFGSPVPLRSAGADNIALRKEQAGPGIAQVVAVLLRRPAPVLNK